MSKVSVLIVGDSMVSELQSYFDSWKECVNIYVESYRGATSEAIASNPLTLPVLLKEDDYDICIFVVGTNDVGKQMQPHETAMALDKMKVDCFKLCKRMKFVSVCTIPGADAFNETLSRHCAHHPLLDLGMNSENAHLWRSPEDGVHLSDDGKRWMAHVLFDEILRMKPFVETYPFKRDGEAARQKGASM